MRKLSADDLRALCPPMDEAFAARLEREVERLPLQKEKRPVKKKLSLVLAVALSLLAVGAMAAAAHWDVMEFLFGHRSEAAAPLVSEVHGEATDGQVNLTVGSALCDGDTLALDWTVENTRPESPVFLVIDDFTANGVRIWGDGTDGFDNQWLPGRYSDGTWQDGENVELPGEITGDRLRVALTVGVYRPIQPIWQQDVWEPGEGAQKLRKGCFVIPEGEGYLVPDEESEDGVAWAVSLGRDWAELFTRTELALSFDLDLTAGRASRVELQTEESYAFPEFTARYTKALLTPVALYLTMEAETDAPDADALFARLLDTGSFELTDGEGSVLEDAPWPSYEGSGEPRENGGFVYVHKSAWFGLSAEQLPETFGLTWISNDGKTKRVMPVSVPE